MRPVRWWLGLLAALAVSGLPVPADAQPVGSEFQANTYTTSHQDLASVAADANGNFVVVWESDGQDGDDEGIFGQRYDSAGSRLGSEFRVNSQTNFLQAEPAVTFDSAAGNFVVVWTSYQDPSPGIFGQRYDGAGNKLGGEFRVNTYTTAQQERPAVASAASGNFVVVWESDNQDRSGFGIFGQRFDSAGVALGQEFQVNTHTPFHQWQSSVASDAGGNFVVVWSSDNQDDGSSFGIFGQRYDSAGNALGSEFRVNTYTTNSQVRPSVAATQDGDFVVAWSSFRQGGDLDSGVFARRYDSAGNAQGPEFRVNTYTTGTQTSPQAATDPSGDFLVAWQSSDQDGVGWGVFGQRYNSTGNPQGAEFRINSTAASDEDYPVVGSAAAGHFVVAWSSFGQDGSGEGIFGQQFDFGGASTIHVGDLDRRAKNIGASWRAQVKTLVHDGIHAAESGVLVTLNISGGVGTRTCTTVASGVCEASVVVGDAVPSLTFTVTSLTKAARSYEAGANHDPDPDSNGTTIVVNQP